MDKHETIYKDIDYNNDNEFVSLEELYSEEDQVQEEIDEEFIQQLEKYVDDGDITPETDQLLEIGVTPKAEVTANMRGDQSSFGQQLGNNFPDAATLVEMSNHQLGIAVRPVAQDETHVLMNHLPSQNSVLNVVETGRRNSDRKRARRRTVDGSLSEEPKQKRKCGRQPIEDKPIPDGAKNLIDRVDRLIRKDKSAGYHLKVLYAQTIPGIQDYLSQVNPVLNPLMSTLEGIKRRANKISKRAAEGKVSDDEGKRLLKELEGEIEVAFNDSNKLESKVEKLQRLCMSSQVPSVDVFRSKFNSEFPEIFRGEGSAESGKQYNGKQVNKFGHHLDKGKKKMNA